MDEIREELERSDLIETFHRTIIDKAQELNLAVHGELVVTFPEGSTLAIKIGQITGKPFLVDLYEEDVDHLKSIPGYDWRKRVRNILHQFCLKSKEDWNNAKPLL